MTKEQKQLITLTCMRYPEIVLYEQLPGFIAFTLYHIHPAPTIVEETNAFISKIRQRKPVTEHSY